jgi:hypothetical protein
MSYPRRAKPTLHLFPLPSLESSFLRVILGQRFLALTRGIRLRQKPVPLRKKKKEMHPATYIFLKYNIPGKEKFQEREKI